MSSSETDLEKAWRELREAFIRVYRIDRLVLWLSRRRFILWLDHLGRSGGSGE